MSRPIPTPDEIRSTDALRRLFSEAETTAALLRSPGIMMKTTGERLRVAQLLETLVAITRRAETALSARGVVP